LTVIIEATTRLKLERLYKNFIVQSKIHLNGNVPVAALE
jgi:hypothetical protein